MLLFCLSFNWCKNEAHVRSFFLSFPFFSVPFSFKNFLLIVDSSLDPWNCYRIFYIMKWINLLENMWKWQSRKIKRTQVLMISLSHPISQSWRYSTSEIVEIRNTSSSFQFKSVWDWIFFFFLLVAKGIITNVSLLLPQKGRKFSAMTNGTLLIL